MNNESTLPYLLKRSLDLSAIAILTMIGIGLKQVYDQVNQVLFVNIFSKIEPSTLWDLISTLFLIILLLSSVIIFLCVKLKKKPKTVLVTVGS